VVITDTNKTGLLIPLTVIGIVTFAETPPQTVNYHTTPMTKRQEQYLAWRKELDKCGWDVTKVDSVQFNSGSETLHHLLAKTATAYILKQNGYRVDSEVEHPERGEIDIIAIPCEKDAKPENWPDLLVISAANLICKLEGQATVVDPPAEPRGVQVNLAVIDAQVERTLTAQAEPALT